jgi:hypothetical protein
VFEISIRMRFSVRRRYVERCTQRWTDEPLEGRGLKLGCARATKPFAKHKLSHEWRSHRNRQCNPPQQLGHLRLRQERKPFGVAGTLEKLDE